MNKHTWKFAILEDGISNFIKHSEKSCISNLISHNIFWSIGFILHQLCFNQYLQVTISAWSTWVSQSNLKQTLQIGKLQNFNIQLIFIFQTFKNLRRIYGWKIIPKLILSLSQVANCKLKLRGCFLILFLFLRVIFLNKSLLFHFESQFKILFINFKFSHNTTKKHHSPVIFELLLKEKNVLNYWKYELEKPKEKFLKENCWLVADAYLRVYILNLLPL